MQGSGSRDAGLARAGLFLLDVAHPGLTRQGLVWHSAVIAFKAWSIPHYLEHSHAASYHGTATGVRWNVG